MAELFAPIQVVSFLNEGELIKFSMLRLDLLNRSVSGNKYFKLVRNIEEVKRLKSPGILSFGGPYSNHLAELATYCSSENLKSVGVVRGTYFDSNPILDHCKQNGMDIVKVKSEEYNEISSDYGNGLAEYSDYYKVPVGGSSKLGVDGAALISNLIPSNVTRVHLAVGTGGTCAGLLQESLNYDVIGHSVVKLPLDELPVLIDSQSRVSIDLCNAFPSFGKINAEMIEFAREWYRQTLIPLDLNYNLKVVSNLVQLGVCDENVLHVNTGGLIGNLGHESRLKEYIYPVS